ncbi:hypothetical protein SDD27957_08120 [Streptococcus dysgalactiae subsp. dysgalactiae ATCC 27957]|nr:hypothetical protein SDD27957_08120 [Streptococcus dysgalactiae subsp. dysgalactiae ATCC 27957]
MIEVGKPLRFKLPFIQEDMGINLDKNNSLVAVVKLQKKEC